VSLSRDISSGGKGIGYKMLGGICRSIYLLQIWLMSCAELRDAAAVVTWYRARSIALSRGQFSGKSN
jgi:hypothetical protein